MAKKGGAIRQKVPPVDQAALNEVFNKAVKYWGSEAFHLGIYNNLGSQKAASTEGLVYNSWWLQQLIAISSGEILPGQLKESLLQHAHTHNQGEYKSDIWAGMKSSAFTTLLCHWRRLKREPDRKRQAFSKATADMQRRMQKLLDLEPGLQGFGGLEESQGDSQPSEAKQEAQSSSSKVDGECIGAEAWDKATEMEEVSVASDGFPAMLKTCRKTPEKKQTAHLPLRLGKKSNHREQLQAAAAAAAQLLAEKTPEVKKKPSMKRPSSAVEERLETKPFKKPATASTKKRLGTESGNKPELLDGWAKVKKVLASKQSYLQGWFHDKWVLLAACTAKMGSTYPGGHHAVITALEPFASKPGMTKDKLLSKRQELLAS